MGYSQILHLSCSTVGLTILEKNDKHNLWIPLIAYFHQTVSPTVEKSQIDIKFVV